ncbi:MAG: hypothetical protein IPL01_12815 [Acidobacteria bacterium]|nr:hypothetical protein [Acidobacteriota bacterium]
MNPNFLLILIIILAAILLWNRGRTRAEQEPSEFPIPRPEDDFVEAPRKDVSIGVERENGVPVSLTVAPSNIVIGPDEQAAWKSMEGKIEIRFSPNQSPFGGTSFTAARGGIALSGKPAQATSLNYIVLLTTSDGYLIRQDATLTAASGQDSAS